MASRHQLPDQLGALNELASASPHSASARWAKRRKARRRASLFCLRLVRVLSSDLRAVDDVEPLRPRLRHPGRARPAGRSRPPPRRVVASPEDARVRIVVAAAAGLDAIARSKESADHQRTRWRRRSPPAGSCTRFSGERKHLVEQLQVLRRKPVGLLPVSPLGKAGVVAQVVADVRPPSLDKMCGQALSIPPVALAR